MGGNRYEKETKARLPIRLLRSALAAGICGTLATINVWPAIAQDLGAADVEAVMFAGIWNASATGYGYWEWRDDTTVCLRLTGASGDCDDRGSWNLEGNKICYELEWWGEAYGVRSACINLIAKGNNAFEVQSGTNSASKFFDFLLMTK